MLSKVPALNGPQRQVAGSTFLVWHHNADNSLEDVAVRSLADLLNQLKKKKSQVFECSADNVIN